MTKPLYIFLLLAFFMAFIGCHKTTDNKTPQSETEQVQKEQAPDSDVKTPEETNTTAKTDGNLMNSDLEKTTEFVMLLSEEENIADYKKAAQLVEKTAHVKGEIAEVSMHFANWYMIELIPAENDDDMVILDGDGPERPAFLVDINQQKVIDKMDFKSAKPLFDRLAVLAFSKEIDDPEGFVDFTSGFVSTVAFGNSSYVGHSGSTVIPFPEFKKSDNTVTLNYHVKASGDSMGTRQCTLSISDSDIQFKVSEPQ